MLDFSSQIKWQITFCLYCILAPISSIWFLGRSFWYTLWYALKNLPFPQLVNDIFSISLAMVISLPFFFALSFFLLGLLVGAFIFSRPSETRLGIKLDYRSDKISVIAYFQMTFSISSLVVIALFLNAEFIYTRGNFFFWLLFAYLLVWLGSNLYKKAQAPQPDLTSSEVGPASNAGADAET